MKKVGKTTRPLRYDVNQIPYDYTIEVTKRFKGLDLVDRMLPDLVDRRTMDRGLWHCIGGSDQNYPQEKEMQRGKMVVWGDLTNSWKEKWKAKDKRKDIYIWMQSSRE